MEDAYENFRYDYSAAKGRTRSSGNARMVAGILIIVLAASLAAAATYNPGVPSSESPSPQQSTGVIAQRSDNWAGYVVEKSFSMPQVGSVSDVKGAWIVPQTNNFLGEPSAFSSMWIGIGGYSGKTIQQIGTDSDFYNGFSMYYAWYEMLPADPVFINMTISPGDRMSAEVRYLGSDRFMLRITDETTGETFSTVQVQREASRESAEWIVEAPSLNNRVLPLEDFGTVGFRNASVSIGDMAGGIMNPDWQDIPLVIESRSGVVEAVPSELFPNETGFNVAWKNS